MWKKYHMNKRFLGIMIAAICMTTAITGCTTTNSYNSNNSKQEKQYISPDREFVFDNDEFTVKKLFEGAMETVRYSKYLKISGTYSYSYSNDIGVQVQNTTKRESSEGPFECEIYRDENGNFSSVLNGEVTYADSMHSNMIHDIDYDTNKQAQYTYYKTRDEIDSKDQFTYYGDGDICGPIDVEQILLFDINGQNIESVKKDEDVYVVKVTGNLSNAALAVDENFEGRRLVSTINYDFDCATHELVSIALYGSRSDRNESNGITISRESKSFRLNLLVDEVSNKEVELPQIPQSASSNGFINNILMGEAELSVKEEIDNPFQVQNEFYSVASAIWSDAMTVPENDRNTLTKLQEAVRSAAEAYEIDGVDCEYALMVHDYKGNGLDGALIRFKLSSRGEDQGYIIIPFVSGADGIVPGEAISLDKRDFGIINDSGRMQFAHDFTPSCQYQIQYRLRDDGSLLKEYEEIKTSKLSNLSDQAEVVNFPEEDWETLKRMASELDIAGMSSVSRYEIGQKSGGEWITDSYYAIDSDLSSNRTAELSDTYGLEITTKSSVSGKLSKLKYTGEENAISWVQIPSE